MAATRGIYPIALLTAIAGCSSYARVNPIASLVDPVASLKDHDHTSSVGFSPSGSMLAIAGGGWDVGHAVYSTGVTLRDSDSHRTIRSIPIPGQVQAVAFSPDGKTLAIANGDYQGSAHIYLFDPATGDRLTTLDGSTGWIHGLAFSPDGSLLVTCGSTWGSSGLGQGYEGGTVTVWEVAVWRERPIHKWRKGTYRSVSFAPGGQAYVTGGGTSFSGRPDSGEICLWDTATGRPLWSRQGHSQVVECVAFAPDGKTLASGGMDGVLKLWDATDGRELFVAKPGRDRFGRVLSVAFSADGKYLAASRGSYNRGGNWGELRVWDLRVKPEREIPVLTGSSPVTCVSFSPDGRLLVAGDGEGTVRLWEAAKVFVKFSDDRARPNR
jgi:dipeptidyl aminopeptidase/acylaminoacyl peptidase